MFGFKPLSEDEHLMKLNKTADKLEKTADKLEKTNKKLKITADTLEKTIDKLINKKNDKNRKRA